jgi:hypothetical protein
MPDRRLATPPPPRQPGRPAATENDEAGLGIARTQTRAARERHR